MDRPSSGYDVPGGSRARSDLYSGADLPASKFSCFGGSKCRNIFVNSSPWNAWISAGFRHFSHLFLLKLFCERFTNFRGIFKQLAENGYGNIREKQTAKVTKKVFIFVESSEFIFFTKIALTKKGSLHIMKPEFLVRFR